MVYKHNNNMNKFKIENEVKFINDEKLKIVNSKLEQIYFSHDAFSYFYSI